MAYSQCIWAMIFTKPLEATQHFKWHITEAESGAYKPTFTSACRAPATVLNLTVIFLVMNYVNSVALYLQSRALSAGSFSPLWKGKITREGKLSGIDEGLCGGGKSDWVHPVLQTVEGSRLTLRSSSEAQLTRAVNATDSVLPINKSTCTWSTAQATTCSENLFILQPWFSW